MNNMHLKRRHLLVAGLGVSLTPLLGKISAFAQDGGIRMVWWGSEERARRTNEAVDLFEQKNGGSSVETEFMGWDDYWTRLATQVAGGNAPDLIQMDYRYLFEYAGRGAIVPLDDFMGKELKIADFGAANLASCSVGGKLFGVNLGVNSFATLIDKAAWAEAGVEAPTSGTTWQQFAEKCAAFAKAGKRKNFYATADSSGQENTFEAWLLQRGKSLYTADGNLGYDVTDATDWFKLWSEIRASGGCVPPDVQALYKNTIETAPLTTGTAATDFAFSNQFAGYQKLAKSTLDLIACPTLDGGKPGHYLKPSQMLSVTAGAKNPNIAVALANFLAREPEGALILGIERGVPAAPEIRDALASKVDDVGRKALAFISHIEAYSGPLPPPPPKGSGENYNVLTRISQEVAFEQSTPEQAGETLVSETSANLKRG
ncbi:ABC transporter substrate-binding protein [Rhizobium sp. G187]|uniref:ABC transporter substrate-binding protein n=1 Tax=Rhizobium sp. G187 TaxID=3451352 RepID=UPI003EE4BEA7